MKQLENRQSRQFFTGTEVEHTPAYGRNTLFVTGTPHFVEIEDEIDRLKFAGFNVEQVYFGTNQSFVDVDDETFEKYSYLISYFLKAGFWVCLDFDIRNADRVARARWQESEKFIPMISAKIPNIQLFNRNATIKIDDVRWGYSNAGVWTHSLERLLTTSEFTDWTAYSGDK